MFFSEDCGGTNYMLFLVHEYVLWTNLHRGSITGLPVKGGGEAVSGGAVWGGWTGPLKGDRNVTKVRYFISTIKTFRILMTETEIRKPVRFRTIYVWEMDISC